MEDALKGNGIRVFVSSIVYDIENDLSAVKEQLESEGYDVAMSMQGTLLIDSTTESCFDTCLRAVGESDVFLGFIRPKMGSGRELDKSEKTITYREFEHALNIGMPCYIFADYRVMFASEYCREYEHQKGLTEDESLYDLSVVSKESIELYRLSMNHKTKMPQRLIPVTTFRRLTEITEKLNEHFVPSDKMKQNIEEWKIRVHC